MFHDLVFDVIFLGRCFYAVRLGFQKQQLLKTCFSDFLENEAEHIRFNFFSLKFYSGLFQLPRSSISNQKKLSIKI